MIRYRLPYSLAASPLRTDQEVAHEVRGVELINGGEVSLAPDTLMGLSYDFLVLDQLTISL